MVHIAHLAKAQKALSPPHIPSQASLDSMSRCHEEDLCHEVLIHTKSHFSLLFCTHCSVLSLWFWTVRNTTSIHQRDTMRRNANYQVLDDENTEYNNFLEYYFLEK